MYNNDNKSYDDETKKELPGKNIDHDFQPEKAENELKENNQNDCKNCNCSDLKNKI